ncbi:polyprenyl synthetase family protein [Pseudozobellia thermophila]|uniref:Geranylgeranyl diphosphate synthase, type II n=1 Tax=Pseudozobellia thermophila TaxID=192903 RepID=A0A1M6C6S8_9FLAO|nr:polyprenyl synthetase family protein [Pseudozobellia thermophila]SHI56679.1 geranylgeranyl diphosphate synthase, type II [Pseudozobellia thermophila]
MQSIDFYRKEFISYLGNKTIDREPQNLYAPISYILGLGGKRLRPVLTLVATEVFGKDYNKALDAALAIEIFHNFSLVHDDIMDDAPLRRGKATVHEKWDVNTGILSGDAMLITAYQLFENYPSDIFKDLAKLFSETALKVCEGQQYDIDFESRDDVTLSEYLTMIEYKTAVLIAAALKMGGIVAGADQSDQNEIYRFGLNLGIAFQLQDDYLDAFGDPETFGKQVGGDIIENKKTYLYLNVLLHGTAQQKKELLDLFSIQPKDPSAKIATIKDIFKESGSAQRTQSAIFDYSNRAFAILDKLKISADNKSLLRSFGESLMVRKV